MIKSFFIKLDNAVAIILIYIIKLYQKTISLDHGPMKKLFHYGFCKYHPTCSEYGVRALSKKGAFKGVPMMLNRILRCNPWTEGGVDDVK